GSGYSEAVIITGATLTSKGSPASFSEAEADISFAPSDGTASFYEATTADVDGDGRADPIAGWALPSENGVIAAFPDARGHDLSPSQATSAIDGLLPFVHPVVGDLDGDGLDETLVTWGTGTEWDVAILPGNAWPSGEAEISDVGILSLGGDVYINGEA